MALTGRAAVAAAASVAEAARAVLLTVEPREKAMAARAAARAWAAGRLAFRFGAELPDTPPRPREPELLPPGRMPKRGRAGSERSRIALLHALAHIEYAAIDLAFDCAARFGAGRPPAFVSEWLSVGADEAMHFALLDRRLATLGSRYGALPAHAGLWEAAEQTRHDCAARLAVVPMALEARGLDVTPATVARFEAAGDVRSARILQRIYRDEIRHVAIGVRWFEAEAGDDATARWQAIIGGGFAAIVKPPFNAPARDEAGMAASYFEPLAGASEKRWRE